MSQGSTRPIRPSSVIAWSEPPRGELFQRWFGGLAQSHGLKPDSLRLASADASFRRYFRVDLLTQGSLIIMDAPPALEDCRPFVKVAQLMRSAGLRAPEVFAWEQQSGFMLLSDLGRTTMMQAIDSTHASANAPLYQQAVELLIKWQLASKPGVLPPYDAKLLRRETDLFTQWYLINHLGLTLSDAERATLSDSFTQIIQHNLSGAPVYVHRDFMPRNLMLSEAASEPLGVIDFQDAVYGPISYDIASLLRDAFLTWDEEFCLDITIRYWDRARRAGLPVNQDFGEFYRAVQWMGLQRHLKVAGIFARLTLRDGKPMYLADTPRFIAYIRATCMRYRELKPLLRLIDRAEGRVAPVLFGFTPQ